MSPACPRGRRQLFLIEIKPAPAKQYQCGPAHAGGLFENEFYAADETAFPQLAASV